MNIKLNISLLLFMVALTMGLGDTWAGSTETKQAEIAARKANAKGNAFASTQVYPAGTRFTITAIHPSSLFYNDLYTTYYGKAATAADCASGITRGIEYEDSGSRVGYYSACFYLDGDSFEYFIYGFKFSLLSTTTPPPVGSTTPTATYSNGTLVLKRMSMDGVYYDVVLKLVPSSNPLAFSVDSVVQSK